MGGDAESRTTSAGTETRADPAGRDSDDRIRDTGTVVARQIRFHVSRTLTGNLVYLVETDTVLMVFDDQGTLLIEHAGPAPGTEYVGSGNPRGPRGPRKKRGASEMS